MGQLNFRNIAFLLVLLAVIGGGAFYKFVLKPAQQQTAQELGANETSFDFGGNITEQNLTEIDENISADEYLRLLRQKRELEKQGLEKQGIAAQEIAQKPAPSVKDELDSERRNERELKPRQNPAQMPTQMQEANSNFAQPAQIEFLQMQTQAKTSELEAKIGDLEFRLNTIGAKLELFEAALEKMLDEYVVKQTNDLNAALKEFRSGRAETNALRVRLNSLQKEVREFTSNPCAKLKACVKAVNLPNATELERAYQNNTMKLFEKGGK